MPDLQPLGLDLYYSGAWQDVVRDDDVLTDPPVVITRGQGDEGAAPRPAAVSARLANDDDRYRTANPESPLYGLAGRNTPMRVSVGDSVRAVVEATGWASAETRDFRRTPRRGKAWTDLTGGGLLERINQWSKPLRSPLTRQSATYSSLLGLWPLEDGRDASVLSQVVEGVAAGTYGGTVTLDSETRPGGAAATVQMGSDGYLSGVFADTTASGWQITFSAKLPSLPGSGTKLVLFWWTDSIGRKWYWEVNNTDFGWRILDRDGAVLDSSTVGYDIYSPDHWVRYRVRATVSAGTLTYEPSWYLEGSDVAVGITGSFAATSTGKLLSWRIDGNSYTDGAWFGNVFAVDDSSLDLVGDYDITQAFNGYAGETAAARFTRLTGELGIASSVVGTAADSMPMGAQPSDTLPNLLKEIANTEDGLIYDARDAIELVFRTRVSRYNQTPALALYVTDLPARPEEVTDNLDSHNIVTASQRDGASVTVSDDTGPLGTQAPPDGIGEYRQTVDVNVADQAHTLPGVATWWLYRGTVDLPRYPQVPLNLAAMPAELIADVEAVDVGDVITISGYRENVIRLYVLGYTEKIGTTGRVITFTCAPDQQFQGGTYDDGVSRYDSASSTLKTALTTTATSATFTTANPSDVWSTTDTPYDVMISGQRCTVTVMGAASLVSGSYDQAATLLRGVNGISKALPAGAAIHVATPGRWAL